MNGFWMSLVRPVDDQAGSLVQLKTLKLPEHASRGPNGSEWWNVCDGGAFFIPKIG